MRLKIAGLALVLVAAVVAAAPVASAQEPELCWGQPVTITGDGGPITGTDGADVIMGTEGADTIDAGAGNDIVCGLGGDDVIKGGPGNDNLVGGDGNDDIRAGNGDDILRGGAGDDALRGGNGLDTVLGGADSDVVAGGLGEDLVRGGTGDDIAFGGGGSDTVEGGDGADVLAGGGGNDVVRGGAGDDDMRGGRGKADRVNGGEGADVCRDRGSDTTLAGCEPDFELSILHINDHHSHLDSDSGDLELAGVDTRVNFGGFPSVVAMMDQLEAEASGEVVKIHAGDAITGTLFFSLFEGEADAALMNEVCFDVFALGNHEFDNSDQGLADFLGHLNSSPDCETATVAANVIPEAGTPLAPEGEILFDENVVIDYDGGQRVGYVGIDIAGKTQNSSSPLDTTQFLDEIETAQAQVDALTAAGVNKIVLVTHIQLANDLNLASQVSGVDVIVGGDSHSLLGDFGPLGLNTSGRYPQRTSDAEGNPVCVVQAWQFSWIVGELNVNFDEDGVVTSCAGTPHLILEDSFQRRPAEDADREELVGEARDEVIAFVEATPELSIVTPDADAAVLLDQFSGQVDELQLQVIGSASEDLCLERIPGEGRSQTCDVADTAVNGGDIQQLVTDAFLARSFEADIAIQNSGGIRIDIPEGDVTIADVFELLPFANTIVNLEMTGEEITDVLEEAVAFAIDPDGSTGAYPYASNLRWDVDLTAADGERLSNIEFFDGQVWVPLDASTFTVATNSFVAGGGDGYATFEAVVDAGRYEDTLLEYAQVFIDYIEQDVAGVLSRPETDFYSTQSIVALPVE